MIVNGRHHALEWITPLTISILFAVLPVASYAGNKTMVGKNVDELDTINKEAVNTLPKIPKAGSVKLKAKITFEDEKKVIEILEKNVYDVTVSTQKRGHSPRAKIVRNTSEPTK